MKLIIDIPYEAYYTFKCELGKGNLNALAEIVANGTPYNPTGDAISREALKAELEAYRHTRNYKSDEDEAQNNLLDNILEDIDNAQAIPLPNEQIAWEQGYEAGLTQSKQDRPKGEWIKIDEEWYDYKCSVCGEKVRRLYPFCHCGADMRKGDAE